MKIGDTERFFAFYRGSSTNEMSTFYILISTKEVIDGRPNVLIKKYKQNRVILSPLDVNIRDTTFVSCENAAIFGQDYSYNYSFIKVMTLNME